MSGLASRPALKISLRVSARSFKRHRGEAWAGATDRRCGVRCAGLAVVERLVVGEFVFGGRALLEVGGFAVVALLLQHLGLQVELTLLTFDDLRQLVDVGGYVLLDAD